MTSTMQLEFSQAMSDFKTMFPDMDREVIEAVLRANQGAVDATIDQLLAMSTDNQNEKLRNELDALPAQLSLINLNDSDTELNTKEPATEQLIDMDDATDGGTATANASLGVSPKWSGAAVRDWELGDGARNRRDLAASTQSGGGPVWRRPGEEGADSAAAIGGTPTKRNRRWNPPILGPLPPGFLRIQPHVISSQDASVSTRDFDLPDEQFAMMLQNEEFMNQLRWNQEFMNALEKEQCGKAKTEDDAAFKERLKHMGKVSRKKFLQMARVFTWQRNKKVTTAKQIDSLPLKEEPSDDEDHHHHQQSQQQQSQHSHNHHTHTSASQPRK